MGDTEYSTGDHVYNYIKKDSNRWSGPTVLGQDGQQVLVNIDSFLPQGSSLQNNSYNIMSSVRLKKSTQSLFSSKLSSLK